MYSKINKIHGGGGFFFFNENYTGRRVSVVSDNFSLGLA
jgi:hypothetical protein